MEQLIIDDDLRAKLRNLNVALELTDDKGHVFGHYTPAFRPADAAELLETCPVSEEELKRRGQTFEGRTLTEIWESLGRAG
jgi:hypothetical protein